MPLLIAVALGSSHVLRAAREPVELDEFQANAVAARIELDLRIGAAFTRLQTLQLQAVVAALKEKVISYGNYRSVHPNFLTHALQDHVNSLHWASLSIGIYA